MFRNVKKVSENRYTFKAENHSKLFCLSFETRTTKWNIYFFSFSVDSFAFLVDTLEGFCAPESKLEVTKCVSLVIIAKIHKVHPVTLK